MRRGQTWVIGSHLMGTLRDAVGESGLRRTAQSKNVGEVLSRRSKKRNGRVTRFASDGRVGCSGVQAFRSHLLGTQAEDIAQEECSTLEEVWGNGSCEVWLCWGSMTTAIVHFVRKSTGRTDCRDQLRIRSQDSLCWPQDLSLHILFGHSFL